MTDELKPIDITKFTVTENGNVIKAKKTTDEQKTEEDSQRLIEHLKKQIEQMKCCENCRHYSHTYGHCYSYDEYQSCTSLSNWRLADC